MPAGRSAVRSAFCPASTPQRNRRAEEDELNRRLDWVDQHGIRPDMETVIENMKADLGDGDTRARL